ncbi:MAG: D-alanyl-D-alanine carboxypeptidase/D-alanyl-D-alanine-endopeptidase [Rhodothermia bacterium]|nr:MAG: D-alanyl-D-alanine carboxypeptidase/D-alanyl-D-alanine-endopeptidase [Rhodothermia bacterium]
MKPSAIGLLMVMIFLIGCQSVSPVRRLEGPRSPKQLKNAVEQILQEEQFENGTWAVLITDLSTDAVLYRHNEKKSFIPASNTKLYTTSAALEQLGPEFTYETAVFIDGPVVDGVLEGNVIVRGSGDPVIGGRFNGGDLTETFRNWADSLTSRGIRTIKGDIIGDDDIFDDTPLGYGWSWDDEPYWYSAEISGLSFNDNNIDFTITAQNPGMPGVISWEPANTSFARITNSTISIDPDSSLTEGYSRERGTNSFLLSSKVPQGRVDRESLTVRNPTLFFVHVLRETLLSSGISVVGRPVDVDDLSIKPDDTRREMVRVATHKSKPLKDIVTVLNKRSQNLYAEQLLRTLGATYPVDDPDLEPGSAEMGIARAMETYLAAGIDTSRLQLVDGSGLSRMNLVTAEMTSSLLGYMYRHDDDSTRAAFYRSLPIGGVDGTLKSRMTSGPAFGKVHAKTGTVSNVSTISGYVQSDAGTPLSFVLMANHYTVKTAAVRDAQDRIIELLATYRR